MKVGNFTLLDCQFMTDHLASLGAVTVSREAYVGSLSAALGSTGVSGSGAGVGAALGAAGAALSADGAELPPPDFFALDRLLAAPDVAGASGPSGQLIAQLLGHTS